MKSELQSPLAPNTNINDDLPLTGLASVTTDVVASIVHLPASGSLQVESIDTDGDAEEPDYQRFEEQEESTGLDVFLASLGITQQHLNNSDIPRTALQQLYQQEFSTLSGLKWCRFDHLMENYLQWPLLSPADVGISDSKNCEYRIRPQERSLLLNTTGGLVKAYAVRGLVQGIELSLLESTHYFIYAMVAYRLIEFLQTGQTQFNDFQDIFQGSSQKGIDSLVRSLAKIEAKWLKLILAAPFLIGALQGLTAMYSARSISTEKRQEKLTTAQTRLARESGWWHSLVMEEIPVLNQRTLGREIQKFERWVRWDGRLNQNSRKQAFELIRRSAWDSKKAVQLKALESLAKIAQGIGLKDFPRLQRTGRSIEELIELLWMKTIAFADLELLSRQKSVQHPQFNPQHRTASIISLPRRIYANYLLWWLGQSSSWWKQRLPFVLLKIAKLGFEALFLKKIIDSIIEAINCPDKPGYQFGNGYQDWTSDYTAECFAKRISLFRTIDTNESVVALVAEIPQYYLAELTDLDLSDKYLTTGEAVQIIHAVVQQGAPLINLNLYDNQLSFFNEDVIKGLSQLKSLNLFANRLTALNDGVFSGLSQLKSLALGANQLSSLNAGVFSGLNQLQSLDLSFSHLTTLSDDIFGDLSQLQTLRLGLNQLTTLNNAVFSSSNQLEVSSNTR
jgi:hypothetical protein